MIAQIVGHVRLKEPMYLVVNTGCKSATSCGVGYQVHVHAGTFADVQVGDGIELLCHHTFSENSQNLYGFEFESELALFKQIVKINGVGPKVAMGLLSTFKPDEVMSLSKDENYKLLAKAPAVGPKTAQKIAQSLQGVSTAVNVSDPNLSFYDDTVAALTQLGYSKADSKKTVDHTLAHLKETGIVVTSVSELLSKSLTIST